MKSNFTAPTGSWQRTVLVMLVSFLPLFVSWICTYIIWPWKYYDRFDPEGIHFAAGLSILKGFGPGNVDNPATPLQTLSAILNWIFGFGILDLGRFRPLAYSVMIVLRIGATLALVRLVLKDLPIPWQISLIWLPWLAPDFLLMSRQWCPEALYYPMGILAVAALYRGFNHSERWENAILAGAAIGVMIGVKFIFVTWAAAGLLTIVLTQRPSIAVKSGSIFGSGVIIGFLIATLPAASRYPRMFEWLFGLATKTGQYGSGSTGFLNLEQAGANLIEVLIHEKLWSLLVITVLFGLTIRKPRTGITVFCTIATLASYALALKHFAPRYLAPTGLILLLGAAEFLRTSNLRMYNWSGIGALILASLMIGKTLAFDVFVHRAFVAERRSSEKALNEFLESHGRTADSVILYGWRSFVPAYTVRFMSETEHHRFDKEADTAFPNEGVLKLWPNQLCYPAGKSSWDFIVIGEDYEKFVDSDGLRLLREQHPSWRVGQYIVVTKGEIRPVSDR